MTDVRENPGVAPETLEADVDERHKRKKANTILEPEILDEFDFSYIPDELKDLICGPETAAAAAIGDDRGQSDSVSKKNKFKDKKRLGENGSENEEYDADEDEESGEEQEEEESSDSELTDEFENQVDDDEEFEGSDADERRKRQRFLLGTHSFLELDDPGLSNALLPKQKAPEKVRRGKKLEKQKYLDLCKELGIQPLRKFMQNMNKEKMDLSRYQLGPEDMIAICKMMENNTRVKYLDLSGNLGGLEGGEAIAKMIENNYTITHLNISSTDILPAFKKICDAISLNITLEYLDISKNKLGDREMQWVANFLKETSTLRELYLSRNKIRDLGASYIGKGLQENESLMILDLAINEIRGEKKSMPLFQGVSDHPALIKIDLMNNSLKDNMAQGISKILANNKQMEFVNVSFNLFDNPGAKTIGNGLKKNLEMKEFVVGPNEWRQDGAANILSSLANPKIETPPMELIDFGWLFDVYNQFLKAEEKVVKLRPDLKIIRGGSFGQWKAKGPDTKALVIRRAKVVCDNFATPLEMLIDELRTEPKNMTRKEFKKFIKSCNLYKNKELTEAFMNVFPHGTFDVDCEGIIAAYDKEYPKKHRDSDRVNLAREGASIHDRKEMRREQDKSIQLMKW